ncbi:hypothetical protein [Butyrivibrio sp. AD3002]|uniref:hypothetical protein n=1 Tax=Butyrivibrio sp. AD3002 TaxID=1280670 RepID=UPI0003B61872|nr:hypothetical protein [Butyrivibrio sp. AD3002]
MAKKEKYKPHSFECLGTKFKGLNGAMMADTSASVFESMLQSDSFKRLTPRQKILYVYLKGQFYGKRKPRMDYPNIEELQSDECFYFNFSVAHQYGLYPPRSSKNFYDDMQALIDAGFIERIVSGKAHRKKSIYRYSDRWKGS